MELGIAVVYPHDNVAGVLVTVALDLGLYALNGGEVADLVAGQVHRIDMPVLIAVLVLQVSQLITVICPAIKANPSTGIAGHRLGRGDLAGRRHPEV